MWTLLLEEYYQHRYRQGIHLSIRHSDSCNISMIKCIAIAVQWPFKVVATMIYDHEWRGAEMRRNFGVLTLSFQMARRSQCGPESIYSTSPNFNATVLPN